MSGLSSAARPRVMFILANLHGGGGSERVVLTVLRHLDRDRFEPHLTLIDRAEGAYRADVPADVTLHALAAARLRAAVPKLLRLLWRESPTVLVSTLGYINFLVLCLRPLFPRTKLVVREVIEGRLFEDPRLRRLLQGSYKRLLRRADRIVTQSEAARRQTAEKLRDGAARVTCIYNTVDRERLAHLAGGPTPFLGAGPHVLAVGRLHPQKGFDLLLTAFAAVRRAGTVARLTVLGEGPERAALARQVEALGITDDVELRGFEANPYPFYGHADVFVLSSRFEGMPNALLEALACGCPAIAFDCPHGAREIIADGINGLLLPPEDVGALTTALQRLLTVPAERERLRAGIAATLTEFSTATIVARWGALLDGLVAAGR